MISDPYKVLEVSENCSDDELKKAYRRMSKKWHPDANQDQEELAEQKFKEIQEAYRQIVEARERGTSAYGSDPRTGAYSRSQSSGGYGGSYGNSYQDYGFGGFEEFFNQWANYSNERRQEESNEMTAARTYIQAGHYREAMTALSQVPEGNRNARWYYYAAHASQGLGSNVDAMNYAKRACDMEPDNAEYRRLLQNLQNGGSWYQSRGETYGGYRNMNVGSDWCLSMLALNICCNCAFMRC